MKNYIIHILIIIILASAMAIAIASSFRPPIIIEKEPDTNEYDKYIMIAKDAYQYAKPRLEIVMDKEVKFEDYRPYSWIFLAVRIGEQELKFGHTNILQYKAWINTIKDRGGQIEMSYDYQEYLGE